jgi:HPt (histidine-containing phosphotransfer) domain-containing protein
MPLVDLTNLKSFCRNDPEKMRQYLLIFLDSVPGIKKELEQTSWRSIKTAIHTLKPQATFLGIESLREQAESLETTESDLLTPDLKIRLTVFTQTLEYACTELVEWVERLK